MIIQVLLTFLQTLSICFLHFDGVVVDVHHGGGCHHQQTFILVEEEVQETKNLVSYELTPH